MIRLPTVRAIFALTGDLLDFDELTQLLPVTPTEKGRRGDSRQDGWPPVPETFWSYEHVAEADALDEVLSALLEKLEPCRAALCELLKRPGIGGNFLVSITIPDERPLYCFSPRTLQRLAEYGVETCLDIFDYSSIVPTNG